MSKTWERPHGTTKDDQTHQLVLVDPGLSQELTVSHPGTPSVRADHDIPLGDLRFLGRRVSARRILGSSSLAGVGGTGREVNSRRSLQAEKRDQES